MKKALTPLPLAMSEASGVSGLIGYDPEREEELLLEERRFKTAVQANPDVSAIDPAVLKDTALIGY